MSASSPHWLRTKYPNIARILLLIRYELRSAAIHWKSKLSPHQRATLRRLRRTRGHKLNIASGPTKVGDWINVDVAPNADIRTDIRRPLPLPDESASLIFCEHFADHMNFPYEITRVMTECYRVLEPGGRVRIVVQDGPGLMRAYLDRNTSYFALDEKSEQTIMEAANYLTRTDDWRHFVYDFETLEKVLRKAGFSRILQCKYGESECADIALDSKDPRRALMSICVEAVK